MGSGPTLAPNERQTGCATICFSERWGMDREWKRKEGSEKGANVLLIGSWEVLLD